MKKKKVNMTNSVLTGMMVGAAMGAAVNGIAKSKKKKFQKTTSKAINAVGEMMQNVSSYIK
ncbi:MAG: hypothetical protein E7598_07930 [Ruminococcaceae bacterium]|nr:hypothetical protein [Oscillospiraceae bacterium]